MKKLITLFCFFIVPVIGYAQASIYFPLQTGFEWKFKVTPLDDANNPVTDQSYFRVDSFATNASYMGKDANIVVSKSGPLLNIQQQPYSDSLFYNTSGTEGFEYLNIKNIEPFLITLDQQAIVPNFSFVNFFNSLHNWYSTYRLDSGVNTTYNILQKDTTVSITIQSIPFNVLLQFKRLGTRLQDETLQTVVGSFDCKKFLLQWKLSTTFFNLGDLITINDTVWIAPDNWIVQDIVPGQYVDNLTLLGVTAFTIPGLQTKLTDEITAVAENENSIPTTFSLDQNYPNPFNPSTKISWQSPVSGHQTLKVYDVIGNEVATLVDDFRSAGRYEVTFDASGLSSGIYFYKLQAGNFVETRKMILLK